MITIPMQIREVQILNSNNKVKYILEVRKGSW